MRIALSKKVRFDIFKRDLFVCQYCGATPPSATLEVDHIKPVSKGGNNTKENLITSCFDCNRGKGARLLTKASETTIQKMDRIAEKEEQYNHYQKLIKKIERRKNKEVKEVEIIYSDSFEGWEFKEKFKISTVRPFIEKLGLVDVKESMGKACSKMYNENDALKYFCGICWNKIRGND